MNNRSTLIPQKPTNKAIPTSTNKPELSRARNSIAGNHFNYQRGTILTSGRQNDPRPITDHKFKEENIGKIVDFLIQESYDKNISAKTISSPSTKEFYYIFEFIFKKIRPDFIDPISEENIFHILSELKYPGTLNKNHLYAIGAPNTSPYLIGVLSWMLELVNYLNYMHEVKAKTDQQQQQLQVANSNVTITDSINLNNANANDGGETNSNNNDPVAEEQILHSYILKAYKSPNIDEVRDQFRNDLQSKTEINMNEKAKIASQLNDLTNQINSLKESSKALKAIKTQHQTQLTQLQKAKDTLKEKEAETQQLKKTLAEKTTLYEQKNLKVGNIKKDLEALELQVKSQPVSYDEYAKMTELKQTLDLSYETLSKRRDDTNERLNQLKKKITEHKQRMIQSQINTFDKYQIKNLDMEKYIIMCQSQSDTASMDIKSDLQRLNEVLVQNVNKIIAENKDKEKTLANLQLDGLRLDDKSNDMKMKINQKENELKAKEAEISNEKTKGNSFIDSYSEEYTKTNDMIQKAKSEIIEKERQVEQLAIKDKGLSELYAKTEIETEEYIKEMEWEYNDTLVQIQKMKQENIQLIRRNYKMLYGVFEQFKNEVEEDQ